MVSRDGTERGMSSVVCAVNTHYVTRRQETENCSLDFQSSALPTELPSQRDHRRALNLAFDPLARLNGIVDIIAANASRSPLPDSLGPAVGPRLVAGLCHSVCHERPAEIRHL